MEEIKYERAYSVLPSGDTRGDYRRERCATRNRIRKNQKSRKLLQNQHKTRSGLVAMQFARNSIGNEENVRNDAIALSSFPMLFRASCIATMYEWARMEFQNFPLPGQNRCGSSGGNLVFVKTTNFEIRFYDHTQSVEAQESYCLQKCLDSLNTFCRLKIVFFFRLQ